MVQLAPKAALSLFHEPGGGVGGREVEKKEIGSF